MEQRTVYFAQPVAKSRKRFRFVEQRHKSDNSLTPDVNKLSVETTGAAEGIYLKGCSNKKYKKKTFMMAFSKIHLTYAYSVSSNHNSIM